MQLSLPYMQLRGGSSRGLYFKSADLPFDSPLRDRILLGAMGGGDARQIDGLGGADPLTSKAAIVGPSSRDDADLDYLFLQVVVGENRVDTTPNCGNILAGVVPFAIESGLVQAQEDRTSVVVHMVNSGSLCEVVVCTPQKRMTYEGDARIDGVPGTSAPVLCNYLDVAGSVTGALLPTGNVKDVVEGIEVTCIDNGMPVVLLKAVEFGITGYESPDDLNANDEMKARLENVRLAMGPMMNLGDVTGKVVPKMSLVSAPLHGGAINTRTFIPRICHPAVGVLGAVSVATACLFPGSITDGIAQVPEGDTREMSVEHPTGEFSVTLETSREDGQLKVNRAGLLRTARLLSRGEVFIPAVFNGIA
jgi:4-oxalomesaconate tautomerase